MATISRTLLIICSHQPTEKLAVSAMAKSAVLKNAHIEVIGTLEAALKELSVRDYDLILTDCEHSEFSPLEILIQLKSLRRETPLVILNTPGKEKTAVACLKHGCDHYAIKDEKWAAELPDVLENVLESHHFKKNLRQRFHALEEENNHLRQSSIYDEATSFYSGPYFKSVIARELKRATRHKTDLACLILDINLDKKNRSTPIMGPILQNLAASLKGLIRSTDVWARLSDSRFAALLPHTSTKQAKLAIKRLQTELTDVAVNIDDKKGLNFSWGMSGFSQKKIKNEEDLIKYAEASMAR